MQPIFVSSTFRDMHYERDVIQTKVVPAVNAAAAKYSESITAFDLRWGVNTADMTEEVSAKKVLNVCMNEIDRCRPYMIVILGYRYGWIPDSKMLAEVLRGRDNFSLREDDISVTALEIEYGTLFDTENIDRTLFYFREIEGNCHGAYLPEDEEHRNKLECLKKRICAIPGSRVRTYRVQLGDRIKADMDSFAEMVTEDICALMQSEWEKNARLDVYELDQIKHRYFLSEKASHFIARSNLLSQCEDTFRIHKKLFLHGAPGSGKSTLISKLGDCLQAAGEHIIPIYCGYTKLCSSGFDILRYIVWELEKELGIEMHFCDTAGEKIGTPAAWYEYYAQMVERYHQSASGTLTFLIDGIDQLIHDDIARAFSYLPEQGCDAVRFILSATDSEYMPVGYPRMEVGQLSLADRKQVVYGILGALHRELDKPVIDKMSRQDSAALPLYLNLMIQRLLMMNHQDYSVIAQRGDGMNAITEYQLRLIDNCPVTLDALSAHVITCAFGQVGGQMMREAVKLIAVSRRGLRLSDMEGILRTKAPEWSVVDAVSFFQYLGPLFIHRKDGRIDFAHSSIRAGILAQAAAGEIHQLHTRICQWLHQLPLYDEIRSQEVVWHMIQADQKHAFAETVAELSFNKLNISGMVKDMVDAVVSDGGSWFIEMVKECFLDPSFPTFSNMINCHLFFGIVDTAENLMVKLRISEIMLEAAQKRCAVTETHGNIWDISVACDRLSSVHLAFDTKEHRDFAVKCSRHSLMIRQKLLERYRALDTPRKQRQYIEQELKNLSFQISDTPSDDQLRQMIALFLNETRRGICVACEDIAGILADGSGEHRQQILEYLTQSLKLRSEMYQDREEASFTAASGDEESELSMLYGRIADIHMDLGGDAHWNVAEDHCGQALRIAQESLKAGETTERLQTWCAANVRYAELYLRRGSEESRKKALAYYQCCVPVLERINTQQRTVHSQKNLADIYNRLGNYYTNMDDADSKAAADTYFRRSRALMLEVSQKCPSLENLQNIVIVTQNHSHHLIHNGSSRKENEMENTIAIAYQKARQLLESAGTRHACDQLDQTYNTVLQMLRAEHRDDPASRRLEAELRACKLDNRLKVHGLTLEDIRELIIQYAELSSDVESLMGSSRAIPSQTLRDILTMIEFPFERLEITAGKRAYELVRIAFRLSELLRSKSDSLEDLDIYAVTLAKYAGLCMQYSTEEFAEANAALLDVAHFLYRKTNRDKYMQMLAMGEMGRMFLSSIRSKEESAGAETTHPVRESGDSDQTAQINRKIAQLEHQIQQLPGLRNMRKRRQLEKELAVLKRQLRR